MINEFNEEINEKEITNFAKRIRKLSDEQIDKLWLQCDLIMATREQGLRAIDQDHINRIRENLDTAKEILTGLLDEVHISDFKKNLSAIEKK